MELSLKHLGKLRKARVPLDGITLISGFNNSGKTTVIKAVYTLMSGFVAINKHFERKAKRENNQNVGDAKLHDSNSATKRSATENLSVTDTACVAATGVAATGFDGSASSDSSAGAAGSTLEKSCTVLGTAIDELDNDILYRTIIKTEMLPYFGSSIANAHSPQHPAKVSFKLDFKSTHQEELTLQINSLEVAKASNLYQICPAHLIDNCDCIANEQRLLGQYLPRDVLLFDDPNIISTLNDVTYLNRRVSLKGIYLKPHQKKLLNLITAYAPQPLPKVHEELNHLLNKLCDGDLKAREHDFVYATKHEGKSVYLDLNMLSSTQKLGLICKSLLSRGIFNKHTLLVWDDFDRTLHPEDQVTLTKFLFLLNAHLGVKIVFSTTSIYVVRALRALVKNHELATKEQLISEFIKRTYPKLALGNLKDIALSTSEANALNAHIKEIFKPYPVNYCLLKCNTRVSAHMSKMRVLHKKNDADLDVLNVHLAGNANRLL